MGAAQRDALALWVKAVNAKGGFGSWCWDVAFNPAEIQDILSRHDVAADNADRVLILAVAAEASPKD